MPAPACSLCFSTPSSQLHQKWYVINRHIYLPDNPKWWEERAWHQFEAFLSLFFLIIYWRRKITPRKMDFFLTMCSRNPWCISLILCPSASMPLSRLILNSASGWALALSDDKFLSISPQICSCFGYVCPLSRHPEKTHLPVTISQAFLTSDWHLATTWLLCGMRVWRIETGSHLSRLVLNLLGSQE